MELIKIDPNKYEDYRLNVIFDGYKWDPQFLDNHTVSQHILVLTEAEHQLLKDDTIALGLETEAAEHIIHKNQHLVKSLVLPKKLRKDVLLMDNYEKEKHIRLMRFDFHPTTDGFAISEVNSDVPGGFAEASLMPQIAINTLHNPELYYFQSFGQSMIEAIKKRLPLGKRLMMVHCTSYSDDRQVMQYLGDALKETGYDICYGAADHLHFKNNQAFSILDHNEGLIDGIIRFAPLEWMVDIKPKHWSGYFNTTTLSNNHPIAIYTQSKTFPFIFEDLEALGADLTLWKKRLPKTLPSKEIQPGFIYKPIWGRVGEDIGIEEACRDDEYQKILKDVKKHPKKYIAQKKFESKPLISDDIPYHVCIGSYYVDGKHAGYYARMNTTPRIDSFAQDIPVIIKKETP